MVIEYCELDIVRHIRIQQFAWAGQIQWKEDYGLYKEKVADHQENPGADGAQ